MSIWYGIRNGKVWCFFFFLLPRQSSKQMRPNIILNIWSLVLLNISTGTMSDLHVLPCEWWPQILMHLFFPPFLRWKINHSHKVCSIWKVHTQITLFALFLTSQSKSTLPDICYQMIFQAVFLNFFSVEKLFIKNWCKKAAVLLLTFVFSCN